MKNKLRSISIIFICLITVVGFISCGKQSLSQVLYDGTGSWDCTISDSKNIKITFSKDGNSTITEKHGSESGIYEVEESNINFLDSNGEVITSIKDAKVSNDTITGTLFSVDNNKTPEITMVKAGK